MRGQVQGLRLVRLKALFAGGDGNCRNSTFVGLRPLNANLVAIEVSGLHAPKTESSGPFSNFSAYFKVTPPSPLQASFLVHGEDATLHPAFTAAVSVMCGPVCAQIASGSFADSELIAAFYTLLGNILTRPSSVSILEHSDGVLVSVQTAVECLLKVCGARLENCPPPPLTVICIS
jgi:hypothetical protein